MFVGLDGFSIKKNDAHSPVMALSTVFGSTTLVFLTFTRALWPSSSILGSSRAMSAINLAGVTSHIGGATYMAR
jgi:hypothetical protein